MRFLGALGGIEIGFAATEIGTGILLVAVEEQFVELVRQVVMMGRVFAGSGERIVLMRPTQPAARAVQQTGQQTLRQRLKVACQEVDQIVKRTLLDRQRPVDESLGQIEARSTEQLPVERRIAQPDRDLGPGSAGEAVRGSAGVDDPEPTDGHDPLEQPCQQHRPTANLAPTAHYPPACRGKTRATARRRERPGSGRSVVHKA